MRALQVSGHGGTGIATDPAALDRPGSHGPDTGSSESVQAGASAGEAARVAGASAGEAAHAASAAYMAAEAAANAARAVLQAHESREEGGVAMGVEVGQSGGRAAGGSSSRNESKGECVNGGDGHESEGSCHMDLSSGCSVDDAAEQQGLCVASAATGGSAVGSSSGSSSSSPGMGKEGRGASGGSGSAAGGSGASGGAEDDGGAVGNRYSSAVSGISNTLRQWFLRDSSIGSMLDLSQVGVCVCPCTPVCIYAEIKLVGRMLQDGALC